jgi:hypothetical protein
MRCGVALALAATVLLVPAAPAADAAKHRKHRQGYTRHHKDQRVVMPARRPAPRPPVQRPPATPPEPRPLSRVQVVAREFSLTLSRRTLAAGAVAIELSNHGEDPHDLRVERAANTLAGFNFTLTKPGAITGRKLALAPGTWKLYCTLDGHAALGMTATLTVGG